MCTCNLASYAVATTKKNFVGFDIKKEYSILNQEYFENKLPIDLEFKYGNSSKNLGVARAVKVNNKLIPKSITISKKFHFTREDFINVLAHEMIHVWEYKTFGIAGHKMTFRNKMAELNKKGFKITVTNSTTPRTYLVENSKLYYILIQEKTKMSIHTSIKYFAVCYTDLKKLELAFTNWVNIYKNKFAGEYKITSYHSSFKSMKIYNTDKINVSRYSPINFELYMNVIKEGQKIKEWTK